MSRAIAITSEKMVTLSPPTKGSTATSLRFFSRVAVLAPFTNEFFSYDDYKDTKAGHDDESANGGHGIPEFSSI